MTKGRPSAAAPSRLRCAIYTRKSSEEGLEQSFNSLDAQREACEAYVMSQTGEGWTAIPNLYDDGGFSGGTMERPGLKRLLADIALRKVDIVVVYKVDRLTRSLADFAKIVEIFDGHGVSFVSVTQAFNTTSSMGRLTLNVLLSFAQFEREVTGERIRDKIAASKKRGMWMGGVPPLGYGHHERKLVIDDAEAEAVRSIYRRYLELRSVNALRDELDAAGVRSRATKRSGESGASFGRGALYHLLQNRLYLGEIVHKGACYPGEHPAIVDRDLFDAVGAAFETNRGKRQARTIVATRAPLTGVLFDEDGNRLCPVASRGARDRMYRYYVSASLQQGERRLAGHGAIRVPAPALDELVLDRLSRVLPAITDWQSARDVLKRVEVGTETIVITARSMGRPQLQNLEASDHASLDEGVVRITVATTIRRWAGRTEVLRPDRRRMSPSARVDRALIKGLGRAHLLMATLRSTPDCTIAEVAKRQGTPESYIRRLARLAFLAPDIQQAILEGRQPVEVSLERLMRLPLPLAWDEQRTALGF